MPKLALFLVAFFILFLFQQSSYGFIEGNEVITLPNLDIEIEASSISVDLPQHESSVERYLVYGSGSLSNAYHDTKNIVYGIDSGKGFFSVVALAENDASKLKSMGYNASSSTL